MGRSSQSGFLNNLGKAMSCNCNESLKRTYYGEMRLWNQMQDGLPCGAALPTLLLPVVVCLQCGHSEFTIPMNQKPATPC